MEYDLLQQKMIYQGSAFDVRVDQVRLPDGREHSIEIVVHRPAVILVPLDDDGMLWFIRQHRHPVARTLLELPAGMMEPGETPQSSAQRELREEIGMAASRLVKMGEFYLAPGYSTELLHAFLATGLYSAPLEGDMDEFLQIQKFPLDQALCFAETGQVLDAKSLATLTLARRHLNLP
jgi:ADP-ribose pyrophosphatase